MAFSDGDEISLVPTMGAFATMNPSYVGRQEVPENLKRLFRSVAMMVPDRAAIIHVKLTSIGFHDEARRARKFSTLYQLCSEQLSPQPHYDWGLRNVASVLAAAGGKKQSSAAAGQEGVSEDAILIEALRGINLPRLVEADVGLFLKLLSDLFGSATLATEAHPAVVSVATAVHDVIARRHLTPAPNFVQKVTRCCGGQRESKGRGEKEKGGKGRCASWVFPPPKGMA